MINVVPDLFNIFNTIGTIATVVDKLAPDNKPAPVEVVEKPVVVQSAQQNTPPINVNLTINVYKDSNSNESELPLLSNSKDGVTLNLR